MRKWLFALAAAMLLMALSQAFAETAESFSIASLEGQAFVFSSGVGAWATELSVGAEGAFTGTFHDAEMGDTGEKYPNGTVYECAFSGRLAVAGQINDYTWKLRLETLQTEGTLNEERIEDGIRFVTAVPYGLENTEELLLYLPGAPVAELPEGFLAWSHLRELEKAYTALPFYGLYNEKEETGMISDFIGESASSSIGMANPWVDTTYEELVDVTGVSFHLPEDATDVVFRVLPAAKLGEMQFVKAGVKHVFRVSMASGNEDISGLYYTWEQEEEDELGWCRAKRSTTRSDKLTTELYQWYDVVPGVMYSLSAEGENLNDYDIKAVAEQIYIPMQSDTD